MINTQPLNEAAFDCDTEEERWICRDLATSIEDRSPYAKHLYESGEAAKCLSEKSLEALELVLREADKHEARIRARKRLAFPQNAIESQKKEKGKALTSSVHVKNRNLRRSRGRGIKIAPPGSDEEREVRVLQEKEKGKKGRPLFIDPTGLPPIVCALRKVEPDLDKKKKGKAKVKEEVTEEKVKYGGIWVVDPEAGNEGKEHDYFVEDDDGVMTRYCVVEDYDEGVGSGPEIPLSPCTSDEWDPDYHKFLLITKGTPPSS